jgi:hypothetical protein
MMAVTQTLSPEIVTVVRTQLGYFLRFLGLDASDAQRLTLGESFPIFLVPADSLPRPPLDNLSTSLLVKSTGLWHHQLRIDNSPVAYATSGPAANKDRWVIVRVVKSALAGKIDAAIELLDAQKANNQISAVLLTAPAFQVHAFLLTNAASQQREILVVQSPFPQLQESRVYGEPTFVQTLAGIPPIMGIRTR